MYKLTISALITFIIILMASCSTEEMETLTEDVDSTPISTRSAECEYDCSGGTVLAPLPQSGAPIDCGACFTFDWIGEVMEGPIDWCADIGFQGQQVFKPLGRRNGTIDGPREEFCFEEIGNGFYLARITLHDANNKCITFEFPFEIQNCNRCGPGFINGH